MALSLPGSTEPQSQLLAKPALYFIGQLVISAVVAFVASRSAAYGAFVLEVLGVVVFLCYTACIAVNMHQDAHFDLKHGIDFIYLLFLFLLWIGQTLVRLNALYRNILLFWELVVS